MPSYDSFKEVTSLSNPLIKEMKALTLKKHREKSNLFLAEGLKFVREALTLDWPVVRLVVNKKALCADTLLQKTVAQAAAQGAQILQSPEKILAALTHRENTQALLGVFQRRMRPLSHLSLQKNGLYIGLDRVRDPGNLGTIIRTADAVGAHGLVLIGACTDAFSIEAVRATMGSIFALPLYKATQEQFLLWRAKQKACFIGTYLPGSVDYRSVPYQGQTRFVLMGNEQQGLDPTLAQHCDYLVKIPQCGRADSLNLAVATGIMLYESQRFCLKT